MHTFEGRNTHIHHSATPQLIMKQFTPEQKHEILLEYQPHSPTHSFPALARRHSVPGGKMTVCRWHQRWNGTVASLERLKVSGRPHVLTQQEVQQHIAAPIRQLNRTHQRVRYTTIAESLREKTHKSISDRTVRRIGKEQLGARKTKGLKRTVEECK